MQNWRNRKGLYMIQESTTNKVVRYPMIATGAEISAWCKSKNEAYGYIPGVGGNRNYSCIAWLLEYKD